MAQAEEDFHQFVRSRLPQLRRAAFLMCGDWARGDDIVQRALTDVYVHWKRVRRAENVDAYVRAVLVHRFIDERRQGWAARVRLVDRLPERAAEDRALQGVVDGLDLQRALGRLPQRQRAVLVLRFFYDMSVEQTAAAMRCAPGTVKSQTAAALGTMRRLLEDEYSGRMR
ncbi:SigE family RNA polymerase sigma factor [Dactylosporangium vinaceum]|uniref:SigE family RNA polymerase sigma factor n=1 Tax=Dactylosporangium vinaceum TaxID=53362 RepID=A0ABV5M7C4_9ACTN|nr:SigE family RNA polymerase sigma factor [Dactylosporangium vinaceum]UAB95350.1 SigE family RNA polymerase sigma factor [Dactylosporangium vinaceum]